jgi:glutamyl-tRNA reductase
MAILAYGVSYRTAPLEIRERLAIPESDLPDVLASLRHEVPALSEVTLISTCNRTELYAAVAPEHALDAVAAAIGAWFARHRPISATDLAEHAMIRRDDDAVQHLIRVAAGLDSQVLGEPQILGQVKSAWDAARRAGALGPTLNLLSQIGLASAKRIRTETEIGRNPVSVAYAAVTLAERLFSDFSSKRALLIGAGDIIQRVAEHLVERRIGSLAVANRTLGNAATLAARFSGEAMPLSAVDEQLHRFDIVIASTASLLPVVHRVAVERAIRQRKRRPIFFVDLAVPRDIEPDVGDLPDVYLYTVDELGDVIEDSLRQRQAAALDAESLVVEGARHFAREQRAHQGQAVLRQFRENAAALQAQELERALRDLRAGTDAEAVLVQLARNLTNKLIHAPTVAIRNASADQRAEQLDFLKTLYQLD